MFGVTTSDDYRPVTWMGRYPIDVTTILVGLHVTCAILAAILIAFGAGSMLAYLQFDTAAVWSGGQVWRLFTYAFVHAPSALLWFAVEMYMLFVFGREVEPFSPRWFAGVALWDLCCLRYDLSASRVIPSNHGEMDRAHPRWRLHLPTSRLPRLD